MSVPTHASPQEWVSYLLQTHFASLDKPRDVPVSSPPRTCPLESAKSTPPSQTKSDNDIKAQNATIVTPAATETKKTKTTTNKKDEDELTLQISADRPILFSHDYKACQNFLKQCQEQLQRLMQQKQNSEKAKNEMHIDAKQSTILLSSKEPLSCLSPRGRYQVELLYQQPQEAQNSSEAIGGGIVFTSEKKNGDVERLHIPPSAVHCGSNGSPTIVVFPKPELCRSPPRRDTENNRVPPISEKAAMGLKRLVLIPLKNNDKDKDGVVMTVNGIAKKGKRLTHVCFTLPAPQSQRHRTMSAKPEENEDMGEEIKLIQSLQASLLLPENQEGLPAAIPAESGGLVLVDYPQLRHPSAVSNGFTSLQKQSMPFLTCYHTTHHGQLFPVLGSFDGGGDGGFLFFKPPMFVPQSNIHSMQVGRGSGTSRYVDMVLHVANQDNNATATVVEFTNIDRVELQPLQKFISSMQRRQARCLESASAPGSSGKEEKKKREQNLTNKKRDRDEEDDNHEGDDNADKKDGSEASVAGGKRRRSQRSAARDAMRITREEIQRSIHEDDDDDDDDDDDSQEEDMDEGGEDSNSDSDCDDEDDSDDDGDEDDDESE